jgi:hypothetical protein
MILYPGGPGEEGLVRFYDLENQRLLARAVPVRLGTGGRVYLSRSGLNTGYVYSDSGEVTVIDMERLRVSGRFPLNGSCMDRAVEIY